MKADITIVGAGPVGLACALALESKGFLIHVVERSPQPLAPHQWLALSYDVFQWFASLGVVLDIERVEKVVLSHENTPPLLDIAFSNKDTPYPFIGGMISSTTLMEVLFKTAMMKERIRFHFSQTVDLWESLPHGSKTPILWELSLSSGEKLVSPLVVGADGRHSSLVTLFKGKQSRFSFPQKAMVFHFSPMPRADSYEHFFYGGSLALLPLPNGKGAGIYIYSQGREEALDKLPLLVERCLLYPITYTVDAEYPLECMVSYPVHFPRAVVVGDAAQVMHPIAGQGLNVGLRGVRMLADHVERRKRLGLDFGMDLATYGAQWNRYALPMQLGTASIVLGFSLWDVPHLWSVSSRVMGRSFARQWLAKKATNPCGFSL